MKKIKLLAILSLIASSAIYGDIKLDSSKLQNTTIEQGKRGNAIININTPNGKGISVNDFENFQTKNGVIFNNSGQRMNISQLEGIINGNPNITGDQAKLILNRVNGTNRTEIEGAMEAVGRNKVDMIFSSPNGIYLNGAKFTGFKDVTFTTSRVNLDESGDIDIDYLINERNGEIEIGNKGLDASKINQLSLLSKKLIVDGEMKVYNSDMDATEAIIISDVGSIYGNQIRLISYDGSVGVKGNVEVNDLLEITGEDIVIDGSIYSDNKVNIFLNNSRKNPSLNTTGRIISNIIINVKEMRLDDNKYNGSVFINGEIATNDLNLKVNNFKNNGNIFVSSKISSFTPYFENSGTVYANNLEVFGRNEMRNYGNLEILNNLNVEVEEYINNGNINVQGDMRGTRIINEKNIEVEGTLFGRILNNSKVKVGTMNSTFINYENGVIESDMLIGGGGTNYGTMLTKKILLGNNRIMGC